ncbi:MAG: hypothetical protein ACYDHH_09840 [Solirubrobacteraceae bacterium]
MSTFPTAFPVAPEHLSANTVWSGTGWFFTIVAGGAAFVLLPFCVRRLVRLSDPVPLLMWIGGFLGGFVAEPTMAHLDHIWWARNFPGPSFGAYNHQIPALIPPCYAFYIGMLGYLGYRRIAQGLTKRGVVLLYLFFVAVDAACQWVGVLLKAYVYYGQEPFEVGRLPLASSFKDGVAYLLIGVVVWMLLPHLHGWRRVLLLLLMPLTGWLLGDLGSNWPMFMATSTSLPQAVQWLLASGSFGLCALFVWMFAQIAGTDSRWQLRLSRAPEPVSAACDPLLAVEPVGMA